MKDSEEFLSHYGVKGMRWGVRRQAAKAAASASKTKYKKPPARLSDAELNRRIKRLELEKKYEDLNNPTTFNGRAYTQSLLENSGRSVAAAVIGVPVTFMVQRYMRSRFGA